MRLYLADYSIDMEVYDCWRWRYYPEWLVWWQEHGQQANQDTLQQWHILVCLWSMVLPPHQPIWVVSPQPVVIHFHVDAVVRQVQSHLKSRGENNGFGRDSTMLAKAKNVTLQQPIMFVEKSGKTSGVPLSCHARLAK